MSHACPAPDCTSDRPVPSHMFACRADWFRLPKDLRNRVWATADDPFSDERAEVVAECVEYYQANPRKVRR